MNHSSPPFSPPPSFELFMELMIQVEPALELGECADGLRRVIAIVGGHFSGVLPRGSGLPNSESGPASNPVSSLFSGQVLPGGADHQRVLGGTTAHMEARYTLRVDEPAELAGAKLSVFNRAIRHASAANTAKLMRGEAVPPDEVYFRGSPCMDSAHPAFAWLSERVFVCTGERLPQAVNLRFFELM